MFILKIIVKAFFVGMCGACALGPIFLMILKRALYHGFFAGFASAFGVACADGIFFTLGLAGTLSVASKNIGIVRGFEFFGGLVLVVFGCGIIREAISDFYAVEKPVRLIDDGPAHGIAKVNYLWMMFSTFLINLSNPMGFIFFATIATRAFPEFVAMNAPWTLLAYSGVSAMLGSLFSFSLISLFAVFLARLLVKKVRLVLEGCTAVAFLSIGIYLIVGSVRFALPLLSPVLA